MREDERLLPDGMNAIYLPGSRFARFEPLDCDPKLLRRHLARFKDPRLAGVSVPRVRVARYAEYMRMDEDMYLNRYLATAALVELEALVTAGKLEHMETGSYFPAGSYRVVCQACGASKYFEEGYIKLKYGVSVEGFAHEFKCPRCMGDICIEKLDTPVYVLGGEAYEAK